MKKVIDGKIYNTETAEELAYQTNIGRHTTQADFHAWEIGLFRTKNGMFFLAGQGGPMTRFARIMDDGSTGWGGMIVPISKETAKLLVHDFNRAWELLEEEK